MSFVIEFCLGIPPAISLHKPDPGLPPIFSPSFIPRLCDPLASSQLPSTTKRLLTTCGHRSALLLLSHWLPVPLEEAAMVTTRSGRATAAATKPYPSIKKILVRQSTKKRRLPAKKHSSLRVDHAVAPPSGAIAKLPVETFSEIVTSFLSLGQPLSSPPQPSQPVPSLWRRRAKGSGNACDPCYSSWTSTSSQEI